MCCGKPNIPVLSAKQKQVLSTEGFMLLNYHGTYGITWQGAPSRKSYRTDGATLLVSPIDVAWFLTRFEGSKPLFTVIEPAPVVEIEPTIEPELPSFSIEAEPLEIDVSTPDASETELVVTEKKRTRKAKIQE